MSDPPKTEPTIIATSFTDTRRYKALNSKTYPAPNVLIGLQPQKAKGQAVYLGDKSFYDVNYLPLDGNPRSILPPEVLLPFPNPQDFATYYDFEAAVLLWKKDVLKAVQFTLPSVLGRYYFRPRVETQLSQKDETSSESLTDSNGHKSSQLSYEKLCQEFDKRSSMFEEDFDDFDVFEKEKEKDEKRADTWETLLYPQEPDPNSYNTYQDYESALKKWAEVCASLTIIPPHAVQMQDLLNIPTALERKDKNKITQTKESNKATPDKVDDSVNIRSGLVVVHTMMDSLYSNFPPKRKKWVPRVLDGHGQTSVSGKNFRQTMRNFVNTSTRRKVHAVYQVILERRVRLRSPSGLYDVVLLPQLHGTFPRPIDSRVTYGDNKRLEGVSTRDGLRRQDLTRSLLDQCLDCPAIVNNVKTGPNYYMYDLLKIDFAKLSRVGPEANQLLAAARTDLRGLESDQRLDNLSSWFNPSVPPKVHQKYDEQVLQVLTPPKDRDKKKKHTISEDQLINMLKNNMYYDKFTSLFSKFVPNASDYALDNEEENTTYMQALLSSIDPSYIINILCLFADSSSSLSHAKLAFIISQAAQSHLGTTILEKLATSRDTLNTYRMAIGISFFEAVPVDIYPYHPTTIALIQKMVGPQNFQLVEKILINYYFDVIGSTTSRHSYQFVSVNRYIMTKKNEFSKSIGSQLQSNPLVLRTVLFHYLNHRARAVSAFFLLLITQLLHNGDSTIKEVLRSPDVDLINTVRKLTSSKFLHVQWAARRLFNILQETDWATFLFSKYPNTPSFEQDLLSTRSAGVPSLVGLLAHELALNCLRSLVLKDPKDLKESREKKFLESHDGSLFRTLLTHLLSLRQEAANFESTEMISFLLAQIARVSWRVMKKDPEAAKTYSLLQVQPTDISNLFKFIDSITITGDTAYSVKSHLLSIIIQFSRLPVGYEWIKKDTSFFPKLVQFCKDGVHLQFNLMAWRLFYKLIEYHSSILSILGEGRDGDKNKTRVLSQFLDIVGSTTSAFVTIHSLRYITKILLMAEKADKKLVESGIQGRRVTVRNERDSKSMEKDIKFLVKFYVDNHLFIHIHMAFMRYCQSNSIGGPFQALAKLYSAISRVPSCAKLLVYIQKNVEYREEISQVMNMHSEVSTVITPEKINGSQSASAIHSALNPLPIAVVSQQATNTPPPRFGTLRGAAPQQYPSLRPVGPPRPKKL
eukprot:TRINITY_DN4387_c0_g1_i1.p1 TRINITY_DN4387_c0_g1~~TRINITY_DN4387_c0_g1_i1.p1  ORF type:complete len:1204 (+),score=268.71 TRINITY_DN4387_c0_g1_i1:6-3617(+)